MFEEFIKSISSSFFVAYILSLSFSVSLSLSISLCISLYESEESFACATVKQLPTNKTAILVVIKVDETEQTNRETRRKKAQE